MKKTLLRIYKKVAVPFYKFGGEIVKKVSHFIFKRLMNAEWCIDNPENFNHDIDQYFQWDVYNQCHWLERGIINLFAIKIFEEPIVCELCCGEGYNSKHFYSSSSKYVYACDFDEKAIKEAKRKYQCNNVEYVVADIRYDIPNKINNHSITNVIWDTAIEHFTEEEIISIMSKIKEILAAKKGILSGHTIKNKDGIFSLEQHEYEFKSMEDLKRFFAPYFKNVIVMETIYRDRHNLYFMASDGTLPFSEGWKHWINNIY